jgi:outer membrane biosynthesis protein TonB
LLRGKWVIGVGVLAFALSSAPAIAQTPSPDPAPVPPPAPPPVVEPAPEPNSEPASTEPDAKPAPTRPEKKARPAETKRPKPPLALRMDRLHPPLAERAPNVERRKRARLAGGSEVSFTVSGSSDSRPAGFSILLALAGLLGAGLVLLLTVPQRLLGGVPLQLAGHRGEVALGGFAVLLGLAVGLATAVLLQ